VENGPRREDGYAPLSGDAVSDFLWPAVSWAAKVHAGTGRLTSPKAIEWQPLSNALPVLFDHYRRAAAGLAAHHLPWFDTCQILKVPRG
jgi:hypothetical protein